MEQKAWKTKCAVPGQGTAHVEAAPSFAPSCRKMNCGDEPRTKASGAT